METPYTSHITSDEFQYVYEPAEDSFLLLDALESELITLQTIRPQVCVEIGSGSGILITALCKALGTNDTIGFAIDINPHACRVTRKTAHRNGVPHLNIIQMDLLSAFKSKSVDLLIFNPPYVCTDDEELIEANQQQQHSNLEQHRQTNAQITKSWAGGQMGRRIIDRLFLQLNDILSERGIFYLLVIKDNDPDRIISDLMELQFNAKIIANRKIRGEHLFVLKIQRKTVK